MIVLFLLYRFLYSTSSRTYPRRACTRVTVLGLCLSVCPSELITSDLESVKKNLTTLVEVQGYKRGGTYGWRRVVSLYMTDPCPSAGWKIKTIRVCGRVSKGVKICDSVLFPVTGGDYTSVCGSIRAYQPKHTDG